MNVTLSLSELLGILAVVVLPGIAVWISTQIKIARLEERQKMYESHKDEVKEILSSIQSELKEIRKEIK